MFSPFRALCSRLAVSASTWASARIFMTACKSVSKSSSTAVQGLAEGKAGLPGRRGPRRAPDGQGGMGGVQRPDANDERPLQL